MSSIPYQAALWLAGLMALAPAGPPNFSGYWQLDLAKSKTSPDVATMWMRVDQSDSSLVVNFRAFHPKGDEENQVFIYSIGVADNQNSMHGAPMKSTVEWRGDALEFHSLAMFGKSALKLDERWTLSADGRTLSYQENSQFAEEPPREALYVFTRREATDWPPDTSAEPVEKHFQNIRVLTGQPSGQLPFIMRSFTQALGVPCSNCHQPGHFERDTQPDKQVARKMIEMTAKMNAENFASGNQVTCWTCHRGALKPEHAPK